jgi:hypothetical protein
MLRSYGPLCICSSLACLELHPTISKMPAYMKHTYNLIPSCIIENITENSNKSESNVHSLRLSNVKFLSLPIFLEIL